MLQLSIPTNIPQNFVIGKHNFRFLVVFSKAIFEQNVSLLECLPYVSRDLPYFTLELVAPVARWLKTQFFRQRYRIIRVLFFTPANLRKTSLYGSILLHPSAVDV